jgi:rubrerythrin
MQIESRRSEGAAAPESGDSPAFLACGRRAEGEFRCAECGYGVVVRTVLPQCPMCRGLLWEADSPFALPAA